MPPRSSLLKAPAGLAIAGILTSPTLGAGSHAHPVEKVTADAPLDIALAPTDLPGPIDERGPQPLRIGLEIVEVAGTLADGAPIITGPSTGRCPARSSGRVWATPSKYACTPLTTAPSPTMSVSTPQPDQWGGGDAIWLGSPTSKLIRSL